jgi:hypothetical protein
MDFVWDGAILGLVALSGGAKAHSTTEHMSFQVNLRRVSQLPRRNFFNAS